MRIVLKKGKQKELIFLAKRDSTWKILSEKLNISKGYLRNELKKEALTLHEELYNKLCKLANKNFDKHIAKKLDDNWGRSKGGKNSPKNLKNVGLIKRDENLAEVFGIVLGDGHLEEFKKDKKVRCYSLIISGNSETDLNYMTKYIPLLFERSFGIKGSLFFDKKRKVVYYKLYGKNLVEFIKLHGISSGNKKKNNQGIPKWIKENKNYLIKCLRGLIDTDGSIHYISRYNKNLRINYTSHIPNLLRDVRDALIFLGFNPSKIICDRQIFLSSQGNIEKYLNEIGFGNQKNLNRLKSFQNHAPVV